MKIGLTGSFRSHLDSLKYSFTFVEQALREHHEVIYLPQEYSRVSAQQQKDLLREWLQLPDLLFGLIDPVLLAHRKDLDMKPPFVALMLGTMSRGAPNLRNTWQNLSSRDTLICNCNADVRLTHMFFDNARTRFLPLAYDDSLFYPMDDGSRNDIRQKIGFAKDDKILLYAGRMTIEKMSTLYCGCSASFCEPSLRLG